MKSVFRFIPKVFGEVEVKVLCRTLMFFHFNCNMANHVFTGLDSAAYKDNNFVLPTLKQQFEEESFLGVIVRYTYLCQ